MFEPQQLDGEIPLARVDRACLVMIEATGGGGLHLSVADPDLNLEDLASIPRELRVTLRGLWDIANPSDQFRVAARTAEETVIEVTCRDGQSYDVELVAVN